MKRILVATDFSTRSDVAIRRAGLLARKYSAEVDLCHVVDDDQPETMRKLVSDEAARMLDEVMHRTPELEGVRCRKSIVLGDPFDGILKAAESLDPDLVIIGSHRRRLLGDIFLGTTAERVIRQGSRPVLIANSPAVQSYRGVLAAVDLSDSSAHALETAKTLGFFDLKQVIVFHAFDALLTTLTAADASRDKIDEHLMDATALASDEVRKFLAGIDLDGVDYTIDVREGAPVLALKEAVKWLYPDLVVLGTRGRSGMARFILGSVAEEAIRELEVDTLAVPPR